MLTKEDLRGIFGHLSSLLPPGPRPLGAPAVVQVQTLLGRVQEEMDALAPEVQRAELVFSWRVPRVRAPRMNELTGWKSWQRQKLKQAHAAELLLLVSQFPAAVLHGAQRKRWLRVTRFSTQAPDELSVDACGGKIPVDSLVAANVLHDDNMKWCHREALWEKTKRGNTHVLFEVFEMRSEGTHADPVSDAPVAQGYPRGEYTRHIESA